MLLFFNEYSILRGKKKDKIEADDISKRWRDILVGRFSLGISA